MVVTARKDDKETINKLSKIDDPITHNTCEAERHFLTTLNAGCQIPAGAFSIINSEEKMYTIKGFISSIDGKDFVQGEESSEIKYAHKTAIRLAQNLLQKGGSKILEAIRT